MQKEHLFLCNKCGLCCKRINLIEQLVKYDNGQGVCMYLIDNLCSIYEKRPLVCRVSDMYKVFFFKYFSKPEYYRLNMEMCRNLQQQIDSRKEKK